MHGITHRSGMSDNNVPVYIEARQWLSIFSHFSLSPYFLSLAFTDVWQQHTTDAAAAAALVCDCIMKDFTF